jgi:hypothetical protein
MSASSVEITKVKLTKVGGFIFTISDIDKKEDRRGVYESINVQFMNTTNFQGGLCVIFDQ